mmetsp:Transcript_18581/g.21348  ORF Transcript_18581/g.21348 Transcript_18581/m.21348 type:complete len:160 (-) Transcript_18581:116-595(-)
MGNKLSNSNQDGDDLCSTTNHIQLDGSSTDSVEESNGGDSLPPYSHNPKLQFQSLLSQIKEAVSSPSTDLNKYLDDIVFSTPSEPIGAFAETLDFQKKSKRMRKSVYQVRILQDEFQRNSSWTKEDMIVVGKKSGLNHYQVYKWYWEQVKKSDGTPRSW